MAQTYTTDQQEQKDQLLQLVGFVIGEDRFALDILMVQEIIRATTITNLPNAPDFIEGVINLRGHIIPVIKLRKRLGLPVAKDGAASNSRILIVKVAGKVSGFIVDSVTKVLKLQNSEIEPPPDIVTAGLESQYITGVCEIDDRLVILLDFSRILEVGEMEKLKEMDSVGEVV